MARTTMSALFADARNKVGDLVLSKWKGRNTVRTRVDPANPQTEPQEEQREAFSACVAYWRALSSVFKTAWTNEANATRVSEFNAFMTANVADERDKDETGTYAHTFTPINADAPMVAGLETSEPTGQTLKFVWDAEGAVETGVLKLWIRPDDLSTDWFYVTGITATVTDETLTVDAPDPATEYRCVLAYLDSTNGWSGAQTLLNTSGSGA